jgi:hypothetical protein
MIPGWCEKQAMSIPRKIIDAPQFTACAGAARRSTFAAAPAFPAFNAG